MARVEFFNLTALFPMLILVSLFSDANVLVEQRWELGHLWFTPAYGFKQALLKPGFQAHASLAFAMSDRSYIVLRIRPESKVATESMAIIVGESGGTVMPRCF